MLISTRHGRLPANMRRRGTHHPTAPHTGPPWIPGHYDGPTDTAGQITLARFMATGIVAPIYRRNPGACLSLLMQAQALDIPRQTALDGIWWNTAVGKGATTAQLMAALLHRAGIRFKVTEESDLRVAMTFHQTHRSGRTRKLGDVEWTILEAIAACLTWREQWRHYPTDMLWARCLMRGSRRYASHVATGLAYTRDELDDMAGPAEGGEVEQAVQDILAQASAPGVTAAQIRDDLVAAAKKRGLLDHDTGEGDPLGKILGLLWGQARAREADTVQAAAGASGRTTPAEDDLTPAGAGILPCGCRADQVLLNGAHDPQVHPC